MNHFTLFLVACVVFLFFKEVLVTSCGLDNFLIVRYSGVYLQSILRVYFALYARIIRYMPVYL